MISFNQIPVSVKNSRTYPWMQLLVAQVEISYTMEIEKNCENEVLEEAKKALRARLHDAIYGELCRDFDRLYIATLQAYRDGFLHEIDRQFDEFKNKLKFL